MWSRRSGTRQGSTSSFPVQETSGTNSLPPLGRTQANSEAMDLNASTRSSVRPEPNLSEVKKRGGRDGNQGKKEAERGGKEGGREGGKEGGGSAPVSSAESIAPDLPGGARDATTDMRTGIAMQPTAERSAPPVKTSPLGASPMMTEDGQQVGGAREVSGPHCRRRGRGRGRAG